MSMSKEAKLNKKMPRAFRSLEERKHALIIQEESRTEQNHKAKADINVMMQKYLKTGVLTTMDAKPLYGDFSDVRTYQESFDIVARAQAQFASLPAEIRNEFNNSPQFFLEYVTDEKNHDRCVELGLLEAKTEGAKTKAPSKPAAKPQAKPEEKPPAAEA